MYNPEGHLGELASANSSRGAELNTLSRGAELMEVVRPLASRRPIGPPSCRLLYAGSRTKGPPNCFGGPSCNFDKLPTCPSVDVGALRACGFTILFQELLRDFDTHLDIGPAALDGLETGGATILA